MSSSSRNPYRPLRARLDDITLETPTIRTFRIVPEEPIQFKAGQFVQLCVPGFGEAPFTPSGPPSRADFLDITVLRTGVLTDALHSMEPGATLGVRGPFGKGYTLDAVEGKDVLLIAGGVGLAPLRSLLYHLFDARDAVGRIVIKYGARTPEELLYRDEYERWVSYPDVMFEATVDRHDGTWTGPAGVVTSLLSETEIRVADCLAILCGPDLMFKFAVDKLLTFGLLPSQIYLSMNRRMNCGIGTCGRCNVGPYLLCKDGPDMNYELIKDHISVF